MSDRGQIVTGALLPLELIGSHVGPTHSHTTGRTHSLSFRAVTAMFGHFGIEWDVRQLTEAESAELRDAVALYKKHRALLHSGRAVHADLRDDAYRLQGVVAQDGTQAVYSFSSLRSGDDEVPGSIVLPGLDPGARYRVAVVYPTGRMPITERKGLAWVADSVVASGSFLSDVGLPMPILSPEHAIVLEVTTVEE